MLKKESRQGMNIYREDSTEYYRYNPKRIKNRITADKHYSTKTIPGFPLHVIIEPTNVCNLSCEFCSRNVMTREVGFMDMEVYKKIIKEISENDTHSISLYDLGESMLHPNIRDMVNEAKKLKIPYVDISSNAHYDLTPLLGTALDEIIISLDGIDKTTYEGVRIGGNYEKVVSNINEFIRAKKEGNYEYPIIRMQIVETQKSKGYIDKFIEQWLGKVDVIYIKRLEGMVQALGSEVYEANKVEEKPNFRLPCQQLYFTLTIYQNGDIAYCMHDPKGESIIGNLKDMSMKEAWHSKKLQEIRANQEKGQYTDFCKPCLDWGIW